MLPSQAFQNALDLEGLVENVHELHFKCCHELGEGLEILGRAGREPCSIMGIGGAEAITQRHFENGGQIEPGRACEIGIFIDKAHF